jgi:hypothetical protein
MKKILKLIFLIIILLITVWLVLFLIDYNRYRYYKKPRIIISKIHYDYDDGYVNEYYSLGYKYIDYCRKEIKKKKLIPLWQDIED